MQHFSPEELKDKVSTPMFQLIGQVADELGMECYVIGGYVRDLLMNRPSKDIDVVVTQGGVAVNPKNVELRERLKAAGLPIVDIHELQAKAERMTGKPQPIPHGDKVVAEVVYRDGSIIDRIYNTL